MVANFSKYNIKVPFGVSGNVKVLCPACTPHHRKPANKNSKDLSVNIAEGIWNCHNCGWKGTLKEREERNYQKPPVITLPMSDKSISWFKSRGIYENTLKHFYITDKMEWMPQTQGESNCILFPYIKNGEWVNVKYRDGKKNFKLTKDAELVIFNYDGIQGKKKVVIVEGEIDCLSVFQAGFSDVCSVPNGASKGNQKLDYIDNSWYAFTDAYEIIIATDNDEAGNSLKNELIRRLGRERCLTVDYPEGCKDFNEVLVNNGAKGVFDVINKAHPLPVEGIHRLTDFKDELENIYNFGYPKGKNTGYEDFDNLLNFSGGQLTVITGVPNSGKSAFLDQLMLKLSNRHDWRFGVCSFENQPITRHITNLAACLAGKTYHYRQGQERMNIEETAKVFHFLNDRFFWFKMMDEDLTCDGILSRAKQLVKTHGINSLVIDPWNYMEHRRPNGVTETEYISGILTALCNFAKEYDVHVFLVAHPTKIKKNPVTNDFEIPTMYDISGSAHFFNKTDNGITVYRNRATNLVSVFVQKVRFFFNGKLGSCDFSYNVYTGQYKPDGQAEQEQIAKTWHDDYFNN